MLSLSPENQFCRHLRALVEGEHSIVHLLEVRTAPLPPAEVLEREVADVEPWLRHLLCWVRPAVRKCLKADAVLYPSLGWMQESNIAAAEQAYAKPGWWEAWLADGYSAARQAMSWLQQAPLPTMGEMPDLAERHQWIEAHLIPGYRRLCANLLLAAAAAGEQATAMLAMARDGDVAALRALALLPQSNHDVQALLFRYLHMGRRPEQHAAHAALTFLAQQQGLPGAEELERQYLLAAAWEAGALAGERVRVGWPEGAFRFRLSLHEGQVRLEALGPHGPLTRLSEAIRHSNGYRQARAAQRETQEQYRLFRRHLERRMLEDIPFSLHEFRFLLENPVYAHLAERLVWSTATGDVFHWVAPGCWETSSGIRIPLAAESSLTVQLAHPAVLALAGALVEWQLVAADRRLVQPFKQLFREVYLPSGEEERCVRFAGCVIDPKRAYAVLRAAGYAPGSGTARREWPHGITAHFCWAEGAVGHDLFGAAQKREVTTGAIWFTRGHEELAIDQVPIVVFSETLRAADLVTSRAAVGDADLTSQETLALRCTLLRQAARTFDLTQLVLPEEGRYALVLGQLATYRINLTTGAAFLEPEGRQIAIPTVDTRWRPAEDGDMTNSILATVLTLAHDADIPDLTFRAQLSPGTKPLA